MPLRHDPRVLIMARTIFGPELVTKAWATKPYTQIRPALDVDGDTIVLEFANGRRVEFTTSEWGHIARYTGALDDA